MKLVTKVEEPLDVKLIIPYVKPNHLLQTVIDCLRIQFVQPQLRKVGDNEDYWKLLSGLWDEGEEFFIVEQDVIVWPGAIPVMQRCENEWCHLPSLCQGRVCKGTFGCVKFGASLIAKHPDVWQTTNREWYHLDYEIHKALESDKTVGNCIHWPAASHLNEIHWPDTISTRYNPIKLWKSMNNDGEPVAYMRDTRKKKE